MTRWKKVFGIGLSRTGTTSLTRALEVLGLSAVHWPRDLSVIDTVDAATDQTVAVAFRELDEKYPGSAFILTTRETESWLASMKWMMGRIGLAPKTDQAFMYDLRERLYGVREFDAQKMLKGYFRHMEAVLEYFRGRMHDLLVIDICAGDGWEKLATFLGVRIPQVPFPRLNRRTG